MIKNPYRTVRARVNICTSRVDQVTQSNPLVSRQEATELALQEIEGGALTFDINQEYDRLTAEMRSKA